MFYNLVAFSIVLFITISLSQKFDLTKIFVIAFLFWNLINGIMVVSIGVLTGQRVFGFAGIMFVDYVAIAIIISLIFLLIGNKKQKTIYISLLLFFTVASIFTQTRNPYISIFFTFISLMIYLIRFYFIYKLERIRLVFFLMLSIFLIFASFLLFQNITPDVTQRATDMEQFSDTFDEEGQAQNSLVSRILIWDTAIAAFKEHPVIGMGLYSFPLAAKHYYTIPKFLFDDYVRGLTPHQTFIAILTETGVIGFIGFIALLFAIIKYSMKTLRLIALDNASPRNYMFAVVWIQIYIVFSMFVTDAWLWGQGLILWAIVLGIMIGIYKKLTLSNSGYAQRS